MKGSTSSMRSKVERQMTLSTSAVAVCCCSDSERSSVRWRNSLNRLMEAGMMLLKRLAAKRRKEAEFQKLVDLYLGRPVEGPFPTGVREPSKHSVEATHGQPPSGQQIIASTAERVDVHVGRQHLSDRMS